MFRISLSVRPLAGMAVASLLALSLAACGTTSKTPGPPKADLKSIGAALASKERSKADTDEDEYRKAREVLEFTGARPGMKVIDVVAGGGYYTELLARVVGPKGEVIAFNRPGPGRFAPIWEQRYGNNRLPNVKRMEVDRAALTLEPASLDAAILIMVYHDMYLGPPAGPPGDPAPLVQKLFAALKPGGVVVVQDHIADAGGSPAEVAAKMHRIDPEIIKRDFVAAGFKFDGASDALRNPADDHKLGIREESLRHHTDRSLLRFRKP